MSLWDTAKSLHKFTPTGMAYNLAKNGKVFGGKEEDPSSQFQNSMTAGMAQGKALGQEIMSDPDLVASRDQIKAQNQLTGPNRDVINQQASKQVANMRYKGSKMSPQQELEAQRKLSSDIGAQKFVEDQTKAQNMYDIDLGKAKFLGSMSMAGAQMALSQQEQKKGALGGMFDSLGLSNIF